MSSLFRSIGSLADRILCVVAALVFLQAPMYLNQYQNVLAGAQKEASISYQRLVEIAAEFDQTIEDYLAELLANDNPKVVANAREDQEQVDRYHDYTKALAAFEAAGSLERPFVFLKWYNPTLATAVVFQPGLPLTMEGFAYALLGIVLMMLLIALVKRVLPGRNKEAEKSPAKSV